MRVEEREEAMKRLMLLRVVVRVAIFLMPLAKCQYIRLKSLPHSARSRARSLSSDARSLSLSLVSWSHYQGAWAQLGLCYSLHQDLEREKSKDNWLLPHWLPRLSQRRVRQLSQRGLAFRAAGT